MKVIREPNRGEERTCPQENKKNHKPNQSKLKKKKKKKKKKKRHDDINTMNRDR